MAKSKVLSNLALYKSAFFYYYSLISIKIMVLCIIKEFLVTIKMRDKAIDKVLWPYTYFKDAKGYW
ncbi:MAG: hypothetical protein VR66_01845 [Peptococcaceae bacterium BRH_c23]|nr:MAG: hypothetical protein VR66_01845 [Peptococcaceae bacterium BRH_c23]KJS86123.1 MAG: hypothetical protein JL57_17255 [Desulfosporosinus sp. BICA1-9]